MKRIFFVFLVMVNIVFAKDADENKIYKRIVVYNMGAAEILYKIEAGDSIVAIGDHKKNIWPEEKINQLPLAGSSSKPSLEKILSFNPDLVIFNVMGDCSEELSRMGIASIIMTAKNLNDIKENIKILGDLTGKKENSKKVLKEIEEKLEKINTIKKMDGTGLVLYSKSPLTAFNKNSLPSQVLEKIGIKSIIPSEVNKALISQEFLLKSNPDYIIATLGIKKTKDIAVKEDLVNQIPILKETDAYQKDNIFLIDSLIILRASHRIFDEIFHLYEQISKR